MRTGTEMIRKWLVPLLLALALGIGGCGGDGDEMKEPPFPAAGADSNAGKKDLKKKIKKKKNRKGMVDPSSFVAKAEWDMLGPHFAMFGVTLDEEIHNKSVTWKYKDAFADRMEKFFPSPEAPKGPAFDLSAAKAAKTPEKKKEEKTIESILSGIVSPGQEGTDTLGSEPPVEGPTGPLVAHTLDKYQFVIIMTGVASPEALVEDPEGETHVVRLNDRIGSEGGQVVDIFKHKILIQLPDQPAPVTLTLAPTSLPDIFASQ